MGVIVTGAQVDTLSRQEVLNCLSLPLCFLTVHCDEKREAARHMALTSGLFVRLKHTNYSTTGLYS